MKATMIHDAAICAVHYAVPVYTQFSVCKLVLAAQKVSTSARFDTSPELDMQPSIEATTTSFNRTGELTIT
jgi:hypothetical protein